MVCQGDMCSVACRPVPVSSTTAPGQVGRNDPWKQTNETICFTRCWMAAVRVVPPEQRGTCRQVALPGQPTGAMLDFNTLVQQHHSLAVNNCFLPEQY